MKYNKLINVKKSNVHLILLLFVSISTYLIYNYHGRTNRNIYENTNNRSQLKYRIISKVRDIDSNRGLYKIEKYGFSIEIPTQFRLEEITYGYNEPESDYFYLTYENVTVLMVHGISISGYKLAERIDEYLKYIGDNDGYKVVSEMKSYNHSHVNDMYMIGVKYKHDNSSDKIVREDIYFLPINEDSYVIGRIFETDLIRHDDPVAKMVIDSIKPI